MQHLRQTIAKFTTFKIKHIALLSALFFMSVAFPMEEVSVLANLPTLQSGIDLFHSSKYTEAYEIFKKIYQAGEWTKENAIATRYLAFLAQQGIGREEESRKDFWHKAYAKRARELLADRIRLDYARRCSLEDGINFSRDRDYISAIICFEIVVKQAREAETIMAENTLTNLVNQRKAYEKLSEMCTNALGFPRDEALLEHYAREIERLRALILQKVKKSETTSSSANSTRDVPIQPQHHTPAMVVQEDYVVPLVKSSQDEEADEVTIAFTPPSEDPAIVAQQKEQFLRDYHDFRQHALRERPYFRSLQEPDWDAASKQGAQAIVQRATILAFKFAGFDEITRNSLVEICIAFKQFNDELDSAITYPEATPAVAKALANDITDITALIIPAAFDLIHLVRRDMKRQKIGTKTVFKYVEYITLFDASQKATVERASDKEKNSDSESDEENETRYMEPPALIGAALELINNVHRGTVSDNAVPTDLDSVKKEFREYAVLSIPNDSMGKQEQKQRKARCRILRDYLLIQYYRLDLDSRKSLRRYLKSFNRKEILIKALGERNIALRDFLRRIDRLSRGKNVDLILLGMNALFLETNDARSLSALLAFLHEKIMAYQSVLAQAPNNSLAISIGHGAHNTNQANNNNLNPNNAPRNLPARNRWFHLERLTARDVLFAMAATYFCWRIIDALKEAARENNALQASSAKKNTKKTEKITLTQKRVRQQQERLQQSGSWFDVVYQGACSIGNMVHSAARSMSDFFFGSPTKKTIIIGGRPYNMTVPMGVLMPEAEEQAESIKKEELSEASNNQLITTAALEEGMQRESQEKSPQPAQPMEKAPSPGSSQPSDEATEGNRQPQPAGTVAPFRNRRTIEERIKAIQDAARAYAEREEK